MYYRYGKFKFRDVWVSFLVIAIWMFCSVVCIVLKMSLIFSIILMFFALIRCLTILLPYREKFDLLADSIIVYKGKRKKEINIPKEITIIVSYADICPPFAVRTMDGNQTHILKDKYAVSIIENVSIDDALEAVHRAYIQKYTTSTIKSVFPEWRYVYGFVCEQQMLDKIISNRKCQIIIPRSLAEKISINPDVVKVYIDDKC